MLSFVCDIAVLVQVNFIREILSLKKKNTQLKGRGRSWGGEEGGKGGLRGWFVELLQVGGNHLRRSRGWIC